MNIFIFFPRVPYIFVTLIKPQICLESWYNFPCLLKNNVHISKELCHLVFRVFCFQISYSF